MKAAIFFLTSLLHLHESDIRLSCEVDIDRVRSMSVLPNGAMGTCQGLVNRGFEWIMVDL